MAKRSWILTLVLLASRAPGAAFAADADKTPRVVLRPAWNVGAHHRYRAVWKREITRWAAPAPAPAGMEFKGEITITVVKLSGSTYRLRWEPTLAPVSAAPLPVRKGDMDAGATELWRYSLAVPLSLAFDPASPAQPVSLVNEPEVRAQLARRMSETLSAVMGDASGVALEESQALPPGLANGWRSWAAPLFQCSMLDLDPAATERWSVPHPSPELADKFSFEYQREVIAFDSRSPRVRVKTVAQPNAKQWNDGLQELARTDATGKLADALSQSTARLETDCTVHRATAWPITVEYRAIGSAKAYEGTDTVRFELIDAAELLPN